MQKPSKFACWLSTFIFCMLFWLLLTMSLDPIELILGAVVSGIVAAVAGQFFIHYRAFYLYNPVRLVVLLLYCCIFFLWEVIKANVAVARIVL
ncbi:MAG: Na+/H+ antiporter subunit E, partial [Clostridiales bacterium]|nr:Na+/H+ antiporter subunit E [Clostridiales bacterium]